jgi:hypothetical protein
MFLLCSIWRMTDRPASWRMPTRNAADGREIRHHRRQEGAGLVRSGRKPAVARFRRPLDQLDVGQQGEGRRSRRRHLRDGTERRGEARTSQGHAGDPDDDRGARRLDGRAVGRSQGAAATAAGRRTEDRRDRLEGRSRGGGEALLANADAQYKLSKRPI